jgi:hypothetical protein
LNVGGDLVVRSNAANANLGHGTVGGSMTATTTNVGSAGTVAQSGALNIGGGLTINAGTSGISLDNAGHIGGALSLSAAAGATVRDSGVLLLGASTVTGGLSVTAAGIFQSAALSVGGRLSMAISMAGGDIHLSSQANNVASGVTIEGTPANVRDFKLRNTSAAAGSIGSLGAATKLRDLTIHYDHAAYVVPSLTMPSLRNVNIVATAISQLAGASMTVPGTATFRATAGAITLTSATNDFRGPVSLTNLGANNIAIADSGALAVAAITMDYARGSLAITAHGPLTQTGAIRTGTGTTTIDAGSGLITLTDVHNDFRGRVDLATTNSASITDANELILGALNVGGKLVVQRNAAQGNQGEVWG